MTKIYCICVYFQKQRLKGLKLTWHLRLLKEIPTEFNCWTTKNLYLNFKSQHTAAEQNLLCSAVCCMAGWCVCCHDIKKKTKKKEKFDESWSLCLWIKYKVFIYLINHVTPTEFYFTHVITDPSRQFGSAHYYAN